MKTVALVLFGVLPLLTGCGGGSASPVTPSSSTPITPTIDACGAIAATAIINGSECSTASSRIALLSVRDAIGPLASCSGTVIAPRAILTAAHCLDEGATSVRVWLGPGSDFVDAASFAIHPNFRDVTTAAPDVGVVLMKEDVPRPPLPLLLSRAGVVGEPAVIAGWGKDQDGIGATHRAGVTPLTAIGDLYLQTQNTPASSSICQGDSGGPLLLQQDGVWAVAGVTSSSSETICTMGTNYYVSVRNAAIRSFILQHVPQAATR